MRFPKRGDIWQVDLRPTSGKEQQGVRPVFIVSEEAFNRTGLTLVCPVTQGGNQARFAGFAVSLMGAGTATQGIVMSNQARTIDIAARNGKFIEKAPAFVTNEVLAKLLTIIE
jgi:mRNA interferase ChpB